MTDVKFRSKLGTNKGVAKSRIWIEGARLVAAGFGPGDLYILMERWDLLGNERGTIWRLETIAPEDVGDKKVRKVSGKGEKPIIDITGAAVAATFGADHTHVDVLYGEGWIEIQGAWESGA
tara:strand:- start:149 stop:511 length:363 start_codon:yes stop_codon:yes gene_type:complete